MKDLTAPPIPASTGEPGLGASKATEKDPELVGALESLVEPRRPRCPESPIRWTCKSTEELAQVLIKAGHPVSGRTVDLLLHQLGHSLKANMKTLKGSRHPDRNAQFRYINAQVRRHLDRGEPLVGAVDSTYILGRGAVRDTYNLIGDGIVSVARILSKLSGKRLEAWAAEHDLSR
jgi:hypothetical protein